MKKKHPVLSKFLKKLNRGLALGLAIVVIMTVWLSVTAAKMKRETPAIRELTKEYLTELVEVSALMKDDALGESIPASTAKTMKEALDGIASKYYTNSRAAQRACSISTNRKNGTMLVDGLESYTKGASVMQLESFEIVEKETVYSNGEVYYNYSFAPELKAGKYLEVWFSFEADAVYVTTDPMNFSAYPFGESEYYGDYEYYGDKYPSYYPDGDEEVDGNAYRVEVTIRLTGRMTFVLENGEWKLACTQNLGAQQASQPKLYPVTKEVD